MNRSEILERVIEIVADQSGVKRERLNANSAIDQDVRIAGGDVVELADALAEQFGQHVYQWPWQRFAQLNEPSGLILLYLVYRLLTWPIRGRLFDPSPFERLELGHIAALIEQGEWFEP